jgi:hypothetical protein
MSKTKKNLITMLCIATMMLTLVACGSKNDDVNVDSSSDDSQNVTSESDSNVKDDVVVSESEDVDSSSGEETTNDVSNITIGDLVINGTSVTIPGKFQPIEGYVVDEDAFVEGYNSIYLKNENSANDNIEYYANYEDNFTLDNYLDVDYDMILIDLSSESVPFVLDGEITETSTYDDVQNFYSKLYEDINNSLGEDGMIEDAETYVDVYPSDTEISVGIMTYGTPSLEYSFKFNDDGSMNEFSMLECYNY